MGGERQGGLLKCFSCPSTPHLAACRNFWWVLLLPWLKDKWHQSPADNQESFRKRQDTWNRMSQSGLTHSARPLRELSLTSVSEVLSILSRGKEQRTMEQKLVTTASFQLATFARGCCRDVFAPHSVPTLWKLWREKFFSNWEHCISLVNVVCFLWFDTVNNVVSYIAQAASELRWTPQLNHST